MSLSFAGRVVLVTGAGGGKNNITATITELSLMLTSIRLNRFRDDSYKC